MAEKNEKKKIGEEEKKETEAIFLDELPETQETKETQEDKLQELTELLQRTQANFENYRKQVEKRNEETQNLAARNMVLQICRYWITLNWH